MRGNDVMEKSISNKTELDVAENIWLNYLNRYLFSSGTITEKEYKAMTEKIAARSAKIGNIKQRSTV